MSGDSDETAVMEIEGAAAPVPAVQNSVSDHMEDSAPIKESTDHETTPRLLETGISDVEAVASDADATPAPTPVPPPAAQKKKKTKKRRRSALHPIKKCDKCRKRRNVSDFTCDSRVCVFCQSCDSIAADRDASPAAAAADATLILLRLGIRSEFESA